MIKCSIRKNTFLGFTDDWSATRNPLITTWSTLWSEKSWKTSASWKSRSSSGKSCSKRKLRKSRRWLTNRLTIGKYPSYLGNGIVHISTNSVELKLKCCLGSRFYNIQVSVILDVHQVSAPQSFDPLSLSYLPHYLGDLAPQFLILILFYF